MGYVSVRALVSETSGVSTRTVLYQEVLVLQASRLLQTVGGDISIFFNYILFKIFGFSYPPEIYYCSQYLIEIMLYQYTFIDSTASEKAATAVHVALTVFRYDFAQDFVKFERFIQTCKLKSLSSELILFLRSFYTDADAIRKSRIHWKYKQRRYYEISVNKVFRDLAK